MSLSMHYHRCSLFFAQVNVVPSNSDLEHIKTETAEAAEKAKSFAEAEAKKLREEGKKFGKEFSREAGNVERS